SGLLDQKVLSRAQKLVVGWPILGGPMIMMRTMTMMMRRLALAVFMLATLSLAVPCLAQSERGSITGVVTDSSKGAIPGVSVKVINTGTNVTVNLVTSASGDYSAPNLSPGTYRVEASIQGFKATNVDGIAVTAGATARVDVMLNLGSVEESVNVVAESAT